jgi:hypothetical protein
VRRRSLRDSAAPRDHSIANCNELQAGTSRVARRHQFGRDHRIAASFCDASMQVETPLDSSLGVERREAPRCLGRQMRCTFDVPALQCDLAKGKLCQRKERGIT